MLSSKLNAALLAIALATGAGAAQATTVTFDDLSADAIKNLPAGTHFATGGYNFSVTDDYVWILPAMSQGGYASNGTTSLDLGGTVTVTNAANKVFSLASIDLASVSALATSTVQLTGTDVSGSQIVQTYTMSGVGSPNPFGLTTHHLTGFNNLTSLVLEIVYNPMTEATYFSLVDNLVFTEQAVSAVPEPETWAMMGLGLAMIAGMSRRKRA